MAVDAAVGTGSLRTLGTGAVQAAVGDHVHAGGGHPDLATHDTLGLATQAELDTHGGAADPHAGYRLETADHSHATTGLQGGTVAHSALTGIVATDHHVAPAAGPDANAVIDAAGAVGTASTFARSGHGHQVVTDSAVASTQAFGDAATAGTSGTIQRGVHKHAMPANPVTGHEAAADPHTGYRLETADHTHASTGLQAGQIAASSLTGNLPTRGGTLYNSAGIADAVLNLIVWRAPFACTVTNVRGYRVGGTGATINSRKNGSLNNLASALSLTSVDAWIDGGAVQNTAFAAGDKLEIMVVTAVGLPTQLAVQVDFTRP